MYVPDIHRTVDKECLWKPQTTGQVKQTSDGLCLNFKLIKSDVSDWTKCGEATTYQSGRMKKDTVADIFSLQKISNEKARASSSEKQTI